MPQYAVSTVTYDAYRPGAFHAAMNRTMDYKAAANEAVRKIKAGEKYVGVYCLNLEIVYVNLFELCANGSPGYGKTRYIQYAYDREVAYIATAMRNAVEDYNAQRAA